MHTDDRYPTAALPDVGLPLADGCARRIHRVARPTDLL
jgi:hypothetical protein